MELDQAFFDRVNERVKRRQEQEQLLANAPGTAQQPQDDSWGITRGLMSSGAGVLQGQAQLGNLMGIGDGAAAQYFGDVAERNARRKEYTIGDMLPFASDYWTNGEGAAYDIGNMLGSSVVLGGETALAAATGGAALGALGVGAGGAAGMAGAARGASVIGRAASGMGRAATKLGMPKLGKVLEGPMGQLYTLNIMRTPVEVSSEMGSAGNEALESGATIDEARRQAAVVGALQMPLLALSNTIESAGLGGMFLKEAEKAAGKKLGKEGLLAILGSVTREGLQNAWEEGMQQSTHDYAAGEQSLTGVVNPLEWNDEALQQAAVGAVGGIALGGGNVGASKVFGKGKKQGGEEAATEQADEASSDAGQEAIGTEEQEAAALTAVPVTPAEEAREYLDTIGQDEERFTPEQIKTIRDMAEKGDDANVMETAAKFGWQAPAGMQQAAQTEQQTQGAPAEAQQTAVNPAATPAEKIQAATDAVNEATAVVANGGTLDGKANTATQAAPAQVGAQQMPDAAVGNAATSATANTTPAANLAAALANDIAAKLKNRKNYSRLVAADNTVNIEELRQQFALKKFINETPDAPAVAMAAASGDKKAAVQFNRYTPERQAAALDAAAYGTENWQYTDADRKRIELNQKKLEQRKLAALENVQQEEKPVAPKQEEKPKKRAAAKKGQQAEPKVWSDAQVDKLANKKPDATPAPERLGDKAYNGKMYGMPTYKSKDGKAKYLLNEKMKRVKKTVGGKDVWHEFNSAEEARNFIANDADTVSTDKGVKENAASKDGQRKDDKNIEQNKGGVSEPEKSTAPESEHADEKQDREAEVENKKAPAVLAEGQENQDIKKTISVEENIANGKRAIQKVIDTHEDVENAMYREDVGDIDFVWGTAGRGAKFKGGYGVAHIIAKRNAENGNGENTLNKLIEVIAKGKNTELQRSANNAGQPRMKIHYDGYTAVLSLKAESKNAWLLTGWEDGESKKATVNARGEGYDSTTATTDTPTLTRRNGETIASSTQSITQKAEESKKDIFEKYRDNTDSKGVIKKLTGISKDDMPAVKEHNTKLIKKLADEIKAKYDNGDISAGEAYKQMKALNGAYSTSAKVFSEVDGITGKDYVRDLVGTLKSDIEKAADAAAEKRSEAISKAEADAAKILENFKNGESGFDSSIEAVEKLKADLLAEIKELGVKTLKIKELKPIYDDSIAAIKREQKGKDIAARSEAERTAPKAKKEDKPAERAAVSDAQGAEQEKPKAKTVDTAEAANEKIAALEALEDEIPDIFDEDTGKLKVADKFKIVSRADELAVAGEEFSDAQANMILAAKEKFKAALDLAEAQGKADEAGARVQEEDKPSANDVAAAVSGFIDTATIVDDPKLMQRAQDTILKSFGKEEQELLAKEKLGEINAELADVYDDKDSLNDFIARQTKKTDAKAAGLLKSYISRMKDAFVKADAIFDFQDKYETKAAELEEMRKKGSAKYSVHIGGKLGDALYQAAWHGSPHIIEGNLTTERIGTGEGVVVHGWGLYFAKSREVSQKNYRERLAKMQGLSFRGKVTLSDPATKEILTFDVGDGVDAIFEATSEVSEPLQDACTTLYGTNWRKEDAIEELKHALATSERELEELGLQAPAAAEEIETYNKQFDALYDPFRPLTQADIENEIEDTKEDIKNIKRAIRILENTDVSKVKQAGELLEVEIPENDVLLDEGKPLNKQPLKVREAILEYYKSRPDYYITPKDVESLGDDSGKHFYKDVAFQMWREGEAEPDKAASLLLNKLGVKGVRYDGKIDGECFVIFDDDAIAIKDRYDAALRKHGEELQRSRNEVANNIKKLFAGAGFEEQENGDLLITTKNGKKILYKISDRIIINGAEAQEARKAHGIGDNTEVTAEGRYRPVYESDIDALVEVGLDSRRNTEAHEATHAVIDLALGKDGAKPLFDRAAKLIKEYGLKADAEEVACDAVRDFITARENGFITTFTADEAAQLKKTLWGRALLKANEMGAKAKVFTDKNEAELAKTAWGKLLLAKMKLQRYLAKLMRNVYDFYKKLQAVHEANDNFHNLARKIEMGEVWGEKATVENSAEGSAKHQSVLRNAPKEFLSDKQKQTYKKDGEAFISKLHDDKVSPTSYVKMTSSPLVLQKLGYSADDIVMLKSKALTAMKADGSEAHAHGLSDKMMAEAAAALHEPIFVMQSKTRPNDSIVVFTEIKDGKGRSIIVPIQITKNKNGIANIATSEYGRNNEEVFVAKNFVDGKVLYANSKKGPAWAEPTRLRLPLGLLKQSLNLEKSIAQESQESNTKFSARRKRDPEIAAINSKYKQQLEEAFERNANSGDITAITNKHQQELAEYLKEKGEKQQERAKVRAAEIRENRRKLKNREIDSFILGGMVIRLDENGKEKAEGITDPNEPPKRTYENKRHDNEALKNAPASVKLSEAIHHEEAKGFVQSVKDFFADARENFYQHFVDKYDALNILDKAIEDASGKKVDASDTVLGKMQMVANAASGMALSVIDGDALKLKQAAKRYGIKNMVSLKTLCDKIEADRKAGKYKDYVKNSNPNGDTSTMAYIRSIETYLTASSLLETSQNHRLDHDREIAEWKNKGSKGKEPEFKPYKFPNNMTEDEIKDIIRSAPKEFLEYKKMFKGFTDNLLDIMLNNGLITADRYNNLKERYKSYVPLYRDFSDTAAVDDFITQINAGKGLGNVSDPLKARSSEGSVRDVVSPLAMAEKTANAIIMKAERNRIAQYAVRQAQKYRLDDFIQEVKGSTGDANNCIFTAMFDGEKHAYKTTPELYPAITSAVEPLCKIQMAVLTKPAQLLRAGSTMSPSFILRNFLRDTIFAPISSKNGFIPIYDSIRGMYALKKNKELRGEFDASGVIATNYYSDAEAIQKSLAEMAGGKTWEELTPWDIAKAIIKKPIAGLEWLSELTEQGTRMGEFMRAREKGKSVEEAAYDAVEVTLNFGRSGATGQQINRMIPFFNACIQGGDKLYRLFKENPRRTLGLIGLEIVLPSVLLWALTHDEDWYKELYNGSLVKTTS